MFPSLKVHTASSSIDLGSGSLFLSLRRRREEAIAGGTMSGDGEPSPTPTKTGVRHCAKKQRMESSSMNPMKQEEAAAAEEEAASGGRALLDLGGDAAAAAAAAAWEVTVKMDRDMLHCPICTLPLKPPVFQCGVGHMACGSCHGQLPTKQCHSCDDDGGGGAYSRCPAVDAFVSKAFVPCPHEAYGCGASVAYYLAGHHGAACAHAPCACGEPGCAFQGSPPMLVAHLAAAPHRWTVDKVQYGEALRIRVPETEPRRLLVAEEDDEDGGGGGKRVFVFVLAVGDRGARAVPVTVACVRAPGAAAAGPQFTCKMWATGCKAPASGKVESVLVDMEVPSTAVAAGAAAAGEEDTFLGVPRKMLRGPVGQMHLSVRIDRVSSD